MHKKYFIIFPLTSLLLFSGKSEAQTSKFCTPSIEPGITVTVSDARNGKFLDANILIKEGKYRENLNVFGGTASGQLIYGGAFERPGRYTIQVSRQGYSGAKLENINVAKGSCHVVTRRINVRLQPLRNKR
jgi:hypothetical protein